MYFIIPINILGAFYPYKYRNIQLRYYLSFYVLPRSYSVIPLHPSFKDLHGDYLVRL